MTWWQSHSDFLAEMRPSARRPDCSQPRLLSSTVLMPWPVLGGYRFTAGQAEYLKTGFKKKKYQAAVEWMQEQNASFSLCCWDPEEERSILVAAVRELRCPWSTLHMVHFTEAL